MIVPRSKAEAKKFEQIVKKNANADDWVSDDPMFSPLAGSFSSSAEEILKHVGHHKLPPK